MILNIPLVAGCGTNLSFYQYMSYKMLNLSSMKQVEQVKLHTKQ